MSLKRLENLLRRAFENTLYGVLGGSLGAMFIFGVQGEVYGVILCAFIWAVTVFCFSGTLGILFVFELIQDYRRRKEKGR